MVSCQVVQVFEMTKSPVSNKDIIDDKTEDMERLT